MHLNDPIYDGAEKKIIKKKEGQEVVHVEIQTLGGVEWVCNYSMRRLSHIIIMALTIGDD